MRAYWSGQIKLSLVMLDVELYPAVNNYNRIPLHEIYRGTQKRVHHQNVVDDKPVEREDIMKGYEYKKGEYVLLKQEEIQAIKIPSTDILEIVQFVDAAEIDALYFERPYFVVPKNKAAESAFAIIREALRKTKKYGLGQIAIAGRERLCTLKPCGRGMMLEIIRYGEEVRDSDKYFDQISDNKIDEEELDLAVELIKKKSAKFHPEKFHDHYALALKELIESKMHKRKPHYQKNKPMEKVNNLMDALKKSLAAKKESSKSSSKKIKKRTSK